MIELPDDNQVLGRYLITILSVFAVLGWLTAFLIASSVQPKSITTKTFPEKHIKIYKWDQINQKRGKEIQ
jgi:hypothetical protein